jgi:hypothetical protein
MKKLLSALFLLALFSSVAAATVPDPAFCHVSPIYGVVGNAAREVVIVSPPYNSYLGHLTGTQYTIHVANSSNAPIVGAAVAVSFSSAVPNAIRVCPSAQHTGVTDVNGDVQLWFTAGGCLTNFAGACVVTANGVEIRVVRGVRSPDNGDHSLNQPDGYVDTVDLSVFGAEYKGAYTTNPLCHDYDYSLACDTVDLTYFGEGYKRNMQCP